MHYRMIPAVNGMRMVALFLKNCAEWEIAAQATFSCGGITVPLYDTLGDGAIAFIINQTQLNTVVCTSRQLENLIQVKPKSTISYVFY